jgi:hypothetical protein
MVVYLEAEINLGGQFTAEMVTVDGNLGLTIRDLESVYLYGTSSLDLQELSTLQPYTFSFNEIRNGYTSFFSYYPEWIANAQELIYTWKNGQLYKHDNAASYSNFYGIQGDAYLMVVFNPNLYQKKSWNSLTEVASAIWSVPNMYTNTYTYGTTKQQSSLGEAEFTLLEANPTAAIKRDANSSGGKINGNYMKGNWLVVKFQKTNANNLVNLSEVSCRYTDSPLNVRS